MQQTHNILHEASVNGHVDVVKYLVENTKLNVAEKTMVSDEIVSFD